MSEAWKPNITVAAIVEGLDEHAGRYLMVEEETRDGLRINQPAGHLDPYESIVDAAIRETLEETAHPFVPTGLLGVYLSQVMKTKRDEPLEPITYLRFAFVGTVDAPIAGRALDELRASRARHRSPMVMRCVEDHASGKPLAPLSLLVTDPSALGALLV